MFSHWHVQRPLLGSYCWNSTDFFFILQNRFFLTNRREKKKIQKIYFCFHKSERAPSKEIILRLELSEPTSSQWLLWNLWLSHHLFRAPHFGHHYVKEPMKLELLYLVLFDHMRHHIAAAGLQAPVGQRFESQLVTIIGSSLRKRIEHVSNSALCWRIMSPAVLKPLFRWCSMCR